jgi:hypothetical protein
LRQCGYISTTKCHFPEIFFVQALVVHLIEQHCLPFQRGMIRAGQPISDLNRIGLVEMALREEKNETMSG